MSWKLAELSWREELGLYQSRWERHSGGSSIDPTDQSATKNARRARLRSRSGTTQYRPFNVTCETHPSLGEWAPLTYRPSTEPQASISPCASSHELHTNCSTVPLLQDFDSALTSAKARKEADTYSGDAKIVSARSKSCSILEARSRGDTSNSKLSLGSPPAVQSIDRSPSHSRPQAHRSFKLQLEFQASLRDSTSGASSSQLTQKLFWATESGSPLIDPFHSLHQRISRDLETLGSPTLEYLNHFLEHDGAIFEIVNPTRNTAISSVVTPEDSAETQFEVTESKHWSDSPLLPDKMASTGRGVEIDADDVIDVDGAHSQRRPEDQTVGELYAKYQPSIEEFGFSAPLSNSRHYNAIGTRAKSNFEARTAEADNIEGRTGTNANVQAPCENVIKDQRSPDTSHFSSLTKDARIEKAAVPPPNVLLPTTPIPSALTKDLGWDPPPESGLSDRISDVLGTSAALGLAREPGPGEALPSAKTTRSPHEDTYRGPCLSDIVEDPTENDMDPETPSASDKSGQTLQPLLHARSSGSDIYSTPSVGAGRTVVVAPNNRNNFPPPRDLATPSQEQEWETTEDDELTESHNHTDVYNFLPKPNLASLPSDTSIEGSQNVVSTWDPLSAKNNSHSLLITTPTIELPEREIFKGKRDADEAKDADWAERSTKSLLNKPLPALRSIGDHYFQNAHNPARAGNTFDKASTPTSAIQLRDLSKQKTAGPVEMPHSSIKSDDGSYTIDSEPYLGLQSAPRNAERNRRMRLVEAAARVYDRQPRRPRDFPNARLTLDRVHRNGKTSTEVARVQHLVSKRIIIFCTFFYFLGGFLLLKSMTDRGAMAGEAMTEVSRGLGYQVVAAVHPDDARLAQKVDEAMMWVVLGACVAILAVLIYAWVT